MADVAFDVAGAVCVAVGYFGSTGPAGGSGSTGRQGPLGPSASTSAPGIEGTQTDGSAMDRAGRRTREQAPGDHA